APSSTAKGAQMSTPGRHGSFEDAASRLRDHVRARLPDADITVGVDRGGLLVRVVDDSFEGKSAAERERELFDQKDISDVTPRLHTRELLTRVEEQWAGPVFREQAELPPVWMTALERSDV